MADEAEAPKEKGSKLKIILIALVAVLLLAAIGGAVWYFFLRQPPAPPAAAAAAQQEVKKPEAIYVKIRTEAGKPYFLVNFIGGEGAQRFLQVYVEARTRDPAVKDAIELHMPLIVSKLQMLFSSQQMAVLQTAEGREKLRADATKTVQGVLQQEIGKPGIEDVFFTNFVMQ